MCFAIVKELNGQSWSYSGFQYVSEWEINHVFEDFLHPFGYCASLSVQAKQDASRLYLRVCSL